MWTESTHAQSALLPRDQAGEPVRGTGLYKDSQPGR
jgi:hypothetical protein